MDGLNYSFESPGGSPKPLRCLSFRSFGSERWEALLLGKRNFVLQGRYQSPPRRVWEGAPLPHFSPSLTALDSSIIAGGARVRSQKVLLVEPRRKRASMHRREIIQRTAWDRCLCTRKDNRSHTLIEIRLVEIHCFIYPPPLHNPGSRFVELGTECRSWLRLFVGLLILLASDPKRTE